VFLFVVVYLIMNQFGNFWIHPRTPPTHSIPGSYI